MIILGIETSCDETAAAIVKNGVEVLSSSVASSEEIHKKYGGIIPEKAAREQLKSIIPVIKETLLKANLSFPKGVFEIDAIAVTVGPGLIGSLLVGVETAKTLAWLWKKPIIPVNHLIAHFYGNFLNNKTMEQLSNETIFPAVCLIVSGGHTELVLMKDHGKFLWIGGTRDDAAGECFDKTARLLGLGYPGGPAISAKAAIANETMKQLSNETIKLPRPMINDDSFDFSFSGLKTAVLNRIKNTKLTNPLITNQLAFEIQEAIADVLVKKTLKAAEKFNVKSILIGGGVAANDRLREKLKLDTRCPSFGSGNSTRLIQPCSKPDPSAGRQMPDARLFVPDKKFCTDNAAMIASAAYFNYHPVPWQKIKADPGLEITQIA